ncbi:MAG: carbonic anhydrase [Bdellovibrionales bacterium]|nr:carbonic anhydrase [Oligoflexia bacterium]
METKNNSPITNPKQALQKLMDGNTRFINGYRSVEPMFSHLKMAELADNGQKPFAIVLTCSDSRSPVEMIFDQGIGEVFVVRVAGNVVAPSLLASIEFAAANFGSCLILVMGHSQCGAISAAFNHTRNPSNALPSIHLEELVSRIRPAVEKTLAHSHHLDQPDLIAKCTSENVKRSMNLIYDQSAIIRDLMKGGKVSIEGAVLDIRSGKVDLLEPHPGKSSFPESITAFI